MNSEHAIRLAAVWTALAILSTPFAGSAAIAAALENAVQFRSPVDGQAVRPGETLAIVIDVDAALGASEVELVVGWGSGIDDQRLPGPPFETTVKVPTWMEEPLVLTAGAKSAVDPGTYGIASVRLVVVPEDPPIAIYMMQEAIRFSIPEYVEPEPVSPIGRYADGSTRPIDFPGMGTTYESSDPSVAVVEEDGRVYPITPGIAYVTVRNAGATEWVAIHVADADAGVLPPVNQTSKVHIARSGFRLEPESGFFVQQVTVTNQSAEPLVRPLVLILTDLPSGVTALTGHRTTRLEPLGAPWQRLGSGPMFLLRPSQSVDTQIKFRNPQGVAITYTPSVYSTDWP